MISSSVICTLTCTGLTRARASHVHGPLRQTSPDSISLQSDVALAERQEHVNIRSKGVPLETSLNVKGRRIIMTRATP